MEIMAKETLEFCEQNVSVLVKIAKVRLTAKTALVVSAGNDNFIGN